MGIAASDSSTLSTPNDYSPIEPPISTSECTDTAGDSPIAHTKTTARHGSPKEA